MSAEPRPASTTTHGKRVPAARVGQPPKRATISDVAERAGVTKAAVSFALKGRPGVSDQTRQRILGIAQELGWQPSNAARALSGGRAGAFGLVIDRPARTLGMEPFFMQLIAGIQDELSTQHTAALLFTVAQDQAAEIALYRDWWAQQRVDGVFLVDVRKRDQRIRALREIGLPAVVIGSRRSIGSLPTVWTDEIRAAAVILEHLASLGHRRIARVTGIPELVHTGMRNRGFLTAGSRLGLDISFVEADYTAESGADATRQLLGGGDVPTAIVYDNDVMAVSGLTAAQRLGVDVPGELSLVAWDDSLLCELVHPALTALHRDVHACGSHAARRLIEIAEGTSVGDIAEAPPALTLRGSTAAPRSR
jgi:DNA-binding LacI/PurR family transcriptional regulator